MKNIIFIAPPAAGKGTVSNLLKEKYKYNHISTGDLLRNVNKNTDLGKRVQEIMEQGQLVSDELVTELLKEKLKEIDGNFILDGYPRNITQANILDEILDELNINNIMAIYINISKEEAMKRALSRLICPKCKKIYNKFNDEAKPKKENICDNCGIELKTRDDDNEESFKVRFETYINNVKPILDFYKSKNMLKEVSSQTSNITFNMIEKLINEDKND